MNWTWPQRYGSILGETAAMHSSALSCTKGSIAHLKRLYDQASLLAKIGAWECELGTEELTWTDGVYDLFELPRGSSLRRASIVDLYDADSRQQMERMRAEAIRSGGSFTLDACIHTYNNATRWMRLTADVEYQHGRSVRIFGTKQDITHEKELWDRLRQLAECDSLTGLANRGVFETRCHELIESDTGQLSTLVLIDLDHFKQINDQLGHAAGDECLRQVAARLHRAFKGAVLVARIGGDEFAVLLRAPVTLELSQILARALRIVCRPIFWRHVRIDVGASIGVATLKRQSRQDLARLFAEADAALYAAKAAGRNTARVFDDGAEMQLGPGFPGQFGGVSLQA